MTPNKVTVVGGGLAGTEAAWYLANKGFQVTLFEMRPGKTSPAHTGGDLAELVCSNSLKSDNLDTGAGLLKAELKLRGSLLMDIAEKRRVPAGAALAVDRTLFAADATARISEHPDIVIKRGEVTDLPTERPAILACGPLASESISDTLMNVTKGALYFIDAISPVISAESIDMTRGWFAGRYGKGGDDYLNLPMSREQFDLFYDALVSADLINPHHFENIKAFERCMPVEVMAARGKKTLLFGPMRPVGLSDPKTGGLPYAVVQLRFENKEGAAYNIVGFQTKMTVSAQKTTLRMIPGLENAEFLRYGAVHRNSYVNAPECLNADMSLKGEPGIYLAGQITGVEGYLESMASGIITAMQTEAAVKCLPPVVFHPETAFGALQKHTQGEFGAEYTPGNFHFGMLPPLQQKTHKKSDRKTAYSERALRHYELH
ncbi:MAG: methylenetetrahydrofolate--tRNA-(uracil(54)-C(5))-methyltransferase (FADH(2)-oxidizing) TrmFO [Deferribacteraceae bacterium]|jgi:methylenetetrahydrofolate--tRNA-(uracil-5-)-methyltransferase|nr:methylenetetrahydrofolate--tRNA-(uracil(54)-C(5))-methyltransferase (FADH(2)-oxidizing) TrmFO [Deferribacteraceae bacterium]